MKNNTVRRTFKDHLFRMIFREKKELLSLYNAINGSHYTNAGDLEINTIEDVIYMGMKNDVSFLLDGYLSLYEAQSTWNPNMPLRGLFYFSRLYQGYVEKNHLDVYSNAQLSLPIPSYIVFYNGAKDIGDSCVLRLSDSFERNSPSCGKEAEQIPSLECTAIVLNINYGHNQALMENCAKLYEYSYFIAEIRKYLSCGMTLEASVDRAVTECIKAGVLEQFLSRHRAEVKDMILTEYNEELHIQNEKALSFQDGMEKGIREFILDNLEEQIPAEKILMKLQKRFSLTEEAAQEYLDRFSQK